MSYVGHWIYLWFYGGTHDRLGVQVDIGLASNESVHNLRVATLSRLDQGSAFELKEPGGNQQAGACWAGTGGGGAA